MRAFPVRARTSRHSEHERVAGILTKREDVMVSIKRGLRDGRQRGREGRGRQREGVVQRMLLLMRALRVWAFRRGGFVPILSVVRVTAAV
jgi:hypothetical protein